MTTTNNNNKTYKEQRNNQLGNDKWQRRQTIT
jgi:hypothetical protein